MEGCLEGKGVPRPQAALSRLQGGWALASPPEAFREGSSMGGLAQPGLVYGNVHFGEGLHQAVK